MWPWSKRKPKPSFSPAECRGEISGQLVALMHMDFYREFVTTGHYPKGTLSVGVGPLQTFIGLAIKNGHIQVTKKEDE